MGHGLLPHGNSGTRLVYRPRRKKEARWGGPGLGGTDPWGGRVGKRTQLYYAALSQVTDDSAREILCKFLRLRTSAARGQRRPVANRCDNPYHIFDHSQTNAPV